MAKDRLIGNYGKVATGALGASVTTGTLDAGGLYVVQAIGTTSVLPAGTEVKKPFTADGTEDLTGSGGDDVKLLTLTNKCDIQNWGLEFSANEVDVTTLCDDSKVYKKGRVDPSGSLEGVFIIGTSESLANNFVAVVEQAGDGGAVTVSDIDDDPIYLILYKQDDDSTGETETFYIVPSVVLSFSDTVTDGEAQSFSSTFRPTNDSEVDFVLYENTIA